MAELNFEQTCAAMNEVSTVLKDRFPNLTVEEMIKLSSDLLRAINRVALAK